MEVRFPWSEAASVVQMIKDLRLSGGLPACFSSDDVLPSPESFQEFAIQDRNLQLTHSTYEWSGPRDLQYCFRNSDQSFVT